MSGRRSHRLPDIAERLRRLRRLLQRDQGLELCVRLELLFDLCELHELLRELVGVQRIERVLVLQLRGQQLQEGGEVARERSRTVAAALADRGDAPWFRKWWTCCSSFRSDANIDTAARTEQSRIAIGCFARCHVGLVDHCMGAARLIVGVTLLREALIAQ
jgi:hypothetical protein